MDCAGLDPAGVFGGDGLDLMSSCAAWGDSDALQLLLDAHCAQHAQRQPGICPPTAPQPAANASADAHSSSAAAAATQGSYMAMHALDIWLQALMATGTAEREQGRLASRAIADAGQDEPLREAMCAMLLGQAALLKCSVAADMDGKQRSSQGAIQPTGNQATRAVPIADNTCLSDMCAVMGSPEQHFHCLHMLLKARLTMHPSERGTIAIYIASYGDKDPAGCQLLKRIMAKLSQCPYDSCGQWGFLRLCARCKTTRYCSAGCQTAHYPAHKEHCKKRH